MLDNKFWEKDSSKSELICNSEFNNELEEKEDLNTDENDMYYHSFSKEQNDKLKEEYLTWKENFKLDSPLLTENELINKLNTDLNFLYNMSVEEYTLYKKWDEIKRKYPYKYTPCSFFDNDIQTDVFNKYRKLFSLKNELWFPNSIDDYLNIEPELTLTSVTYDPKDDLIQAKEAGKFFDLDSVKNKNEKLKDKNAVKIPLGKGKQQENEEWNSLRTFTHTQINNSNIGRNLFYIVKDKKTQKYLGVICVSSDFMDLTPRDNYIGWSREIKTSQRMINHTAIGSTICPTQPLGFNYVGGKLLALLTISDIIANEWEKRYGDVLASFTTTSLYSSFSQYQNLSYWKKMGHSAGSIKFEPSKETLHEVKKWLSVNYPLKFWEWYIAKEPKGGMPLKRDHRQRSLSFVYSKLNIDKSKTQADHKRGIYYCPLYNNTKEFLRKDITKEQLTGKIDNSIENLTNIWKTKYAPKRINSLIKSDRVNNSTLFYDDLIYLTWEEAKAKYLKEVGR